MTYSLAGRCDRTGMLGAVIATSSIAVGSRCVYARAGVGVVLTQHRTDPRLGPCGLMLLEGGCDPAATVAALVASTPDAAWRQLAVLDHRGIAAHFDGEHIVSTRGAAIGPGCVAIGNILRDAAVPRAMVDAFTADPNRPLAERLLAALEAGDAAGGELKPVRSAALLIVHEQSFPYVDLRVDAADAPIAALRALWEEYAPEADAFVTRAIAPGSIAGPVT